MKEKKYVDCDRCGVTIQIAGDGPELVYTYSVYENGVLCSRCAKVRAFDDDNPVLY